MLIIRRPFTDPYFNIAAEEYLLKSVDCDCFMLWQNEFSVIVGKHQNTFAEINLPFIIEKNIPVIRRISGGGAVFHDPGNVNFTFITQGERGKLVDFRKFLDPVIEALKMLGIPAEFEGKNNICVHGLKISGNAEHIYKNKVLHHGTLLYASDLEMLGRALQTHPGKYIDKAVPSIRSKVARISDFMDQSWPVNVFMRKITDLFEKSAPEVSIADLKPAEIDAIDELATEKYRTWEWNFGYSPDYIFRNEWTENEHVWKAQLDVKNGIINKCEIKIDAKSVEIGNFFEYLLTGKRHEYNTLNEILISNSGRFNSNKFDSNIILQSLF